VVCFVSGFIYTSSEVHGNRQALRFFCERLAEFLGAVALAIS